MFAPLRKPAAPKSPRPATACRDASPRHLHIRTVSRRTGRRSGRRRKGQTGTVTTAASTAGNATTTVAHGTSFGSLRRAAASGADAIPPNSSSRSIEVHGRKQAPFYPRALAATRKVDGRRAVHRARGARRDGEGERVVRAPLSRALSLSLALSRRYSPSLSLSLSPSLSLARHYSVYPTRVRESLRRTYDHPKNSPEDSSARRTDGFTTFDAHWNYSPLSHCRLYASLRSDRRDVSIIRGHLRGARLLRVPYSEYSDKGLPTKKENRNCSTTSRLRSSSRTTDLFFSRATHRSVSPPRLRFLSPDSFPSPFFLFSFCSAGRERRTTPAAHRNRRVLREDTN